jgi:hypothetical protein
VIEVAAGLAPAGAGLRTGPFEAIRRIIDSTMPQTPTRSTILDALASHRDELRRR